VLLGLSGSVAAIKAEELVKALSAFADVRVVTTAKAAHFFSPEALTEACHVEVLTDVDEWAAWQERGDPVQHIELRRWADLFIIAPTSVIALLPR
jgi:phosphopantothenoylcysteine decarboxylase